MKGPLSACMDWMHCVPASGGILQYETNQVLWRLRDEGVDINILDELRKSIKFPGSRGPPKEYFVKHLGAREGHMRGFAADALAALDVLVFFSNHDVRWPAAMGEHKRCLGLLSKMMDIWRSGEKAVGCVDTLMSLCTDHHHMFLRVHGAQFAKPKMHLTYHCVMSLDEYKANLSTFSFEAKHKDLRNAGQHASGNNVELSVTMRVLGAFVARFQDADFVGFRIHGATKDASEYREELLRINPNVGTNILSAKSADIHLVAGLRCLDCVQVFVEGGTVVGTVKLFLSSSRMDGPGRNVYVVFNVLERTGPDHNSWRPTGRFGLVDQSDVACVLPYLHVHTQGVICPLFTQCPWLQ